MPYSGSSLVAEDLLRCHLGGLVTLAGDKIPKGFTSHPDWTSLESSKLASTVDRYRAFLRSPEFLE